MEKSTAISFACSLAVACLVGGGTRVLPHVLRNEVVLLGLLSWRSYECQWEDDKALDSMEEGSRSIHYHADGTESTIQGDELRNLMRRINEQRMMVSLAE